MNLVDNEYKKCKNTVKLWERDFKRRENRAPSKDDIRLAPNGVKEAYKYYWLTKTLSLEKAILDDKKYDSVAVALPVEEEFKNIETSPHPVSKEFSNEVSDNDSLWGQHIKKVAKERKETFYDSSSFDFTKKLFNGIKLKRKNLKKIVSEKQSELPRTTEDLQCNFSDNISSLIAKTDENDYNWCFNSVKVINKESKIAIQPVSILQITENSSNLEFDFRSKLNEDWLERCQQNVAENVSRIQGKDCAPEKTNTLRLEENFKHSNIDSSLQCINICSETDKYSTSCISSSDDYVYSSDDEPVELSNNFAYTEPIVSKPMIAEKRHEEELPRSSKKLRTSVTSKQIRELKLEIMKKKMNDGTANDNFVKIDLKRKRFSRGKKTISSTRYKVQQWKAKRQFAITHSGNSEIVLKCFRCGDIGHFARQCKKQNTLIPVEKEIEENLNLLPTLEEAAAITFREKSCAFEAERIIVSESSTNELNFRKEIYLNSVKPLYEYQKNGALIDTPNEIFEALKKFGYQNFRAGQECAVMRILSGKSTLVISGTGSGKSLCYQLPAYLYSQRYKCVSLVVSPLVSLMEDQVLNFPAFLKAACLHRNQTDRSRKRIIDKLGNNEISVLLVSPETIISGEYGIFGEALLKNFPAIAFVCIDEVHCLSQWSHNFRPSYFVICKILRERFNIKTFLGLTATASKNSLANITQYLGIDQDSGILQEGILPENLVLSVSKDESKDIALLSLLKKPPFSEFHSIIIYCLRRIECDRLASFLRTSLQNSKRQLPECGENHLISNEIEVYHAGISATRRKIVQDNFMLGKLRIVIATVAFGMGINKLNIRGVIHYNMPRAFEQYVQEIGRAGRDGLSARCHLFYDRKGNDVPELKRFIYRDCVDRSIIRELLCKVFPRCLCKDGCRKHEIAFSIENTVHDLDLDQENIFTLLCYLELLPGNLIEVLPVTYTKCTVVSCHGFLALKQAARKCFPLAFGISEYYQNAKMTATPTKLEFSVIELADRIDWDSTTVKRELKCLNEKWKKTGIQVNFQNLGFHVRSSGNLSDEQLDIALESLYNRVTLQEKTALHQLKICDLAFSSVAYDNIHHVNISEDLNERNKNLRKIVRSYFIEENKFSDNDWAENDLLDEPLVIDNIHKLVSSYRDCKFNARCIARIFHGIESPNFPAVIWARTPYWRCAMGENYNALYRLVCRELLKFK